ncbi:hypothetical protein FACS189437_04300 [Bacteroidia bacterium]|nr:hypothetical protein FACS189437_04300 [Bacteroidia bacterium]
MKKIIILGFLTLNIYVMPVCAYDNGGTAEDPFDWGATCDLCWDEPAATYNDDSSDDDSSDDDPYDWGAGCSSCWDEPAATYYGSNNDDIWNTWWGSSGYNYGNGSGSGNGNSNGNKIKAALNHLSSQAQAILEQKLREMLAYCAYQEMYTHLQQEGAMFNDIYIDPNISGGGYNPCTDKLLFTNEGNINESFPEEFIHFFQDHFYPGGICAYLGSAQHYNIEFEAKFMQDIINHYGMMNGGGGMQYYGEGDNYILYRDWIDYLTNEGTSIPSLSKILQSFQSYTYKDFMQDWANKNGVPIDTTFTLNVFSIFDGCW